METTVSAEVRGGGGRPVLSWYGLAFTVPSAVYIVIVSLIVKILQIMAIEGSFQVGTLLQAWAPDVALALVLAVGLGAAFSALPRWGRIALAIPFYLFIAYASIITISSHFYFLKTGTNFSWSTLDYWFKNFEDTNKIMASEGGGLKVLLSVGQIVLLGCFVAVPLVPRIQRYLSAKSVIPNCRAWAVLGGALAAATGLALVPVSEGPSMAACRSIPVTLISDLMHDLVLPQEQVVIGESEKLDASLEVRSAEGVRKRNVVVIMFESLRWKSSDAYVPDLGTTPYLAELAKEGALVENEYTVLPHTTKAVAAINCGIYPYLDTDPKEATPGILPKRCLAHVLRSQGYKTAFFQPAANFEKRDQLVANMGYEVYKGLNDQPQEGFEDTNYFGKEERMMLQPSFDWLDSVKGQPFLLTYLTLCTHHNYVTPQSWPRKDYVDDDEDLNNYLNGVRYTDDFIRQVMEGLKERGLLENTVVVIVGDHGEAFGEHGRRQHDLVLWEEGLRSFALWYAPGLVEPGSKVTGWRSHLDIVPTILDLLGIEVVKGGFLGQSEFQPEPADRTQYYSCWFERRCLAMRQGPLKVIYHYDQLPMEVYDNSTDPFEQHNLAFSGEYNGAWLESKKEEMLHWGRVVNQQYDDWGESILSQVVSDTEPEYQTPMKAVFDGKVELVGYSLDKEKVKAGETVQLRLVFHCLEEMKASDALFLHGMHKSGVVNADHVPAGGAYPLGQWEKGKYVVDEVPIHVPATWPKGEMKLGLGFWNKQSKKRFQVETEGEVVENRLIVAKIPVEASGQTASVLTVDQRRERIQDWIGFDKPEVGKEFGVQFGDGAVLEGIDFHKVDVPLAGTVEMTYTFRALREKLNWKLSVKLIREDGVSIDGDHDPIGGMYPTKYWRQGEYIRDRHRIHIDGNTSRPGTYGIYVGFREGHNPVPVPKGVESDGEGRIRVGTAVLTEPTQPHK